jgi:hypothetical protein
MLAPAVVR